MKKFIAIAIFVVAGIGTAMAQETAKIEFKNETIDYGEIKEGSDGVRVFEFTNTGNVPLVIANVTSSCGCTIPKKPEEPIQPGKTGEIQVKYNTKLVGPIRKTITVYSNASEPTKSLKIKGRVIEEDNSGR
jgi:ABC-type molybdate transport system substrate-binding protein